MSRCALVADSSQNVKVRGHDWFQQHHGNTLFCHAVTLISSQRFLHKMTNSTAVLIAPIHACLTSKLSQETQYLASILSNTLVIKCIFCNISCALGKWSLHSRWNFISAFTELQVHGDECWPTEVMSSKYFHGVDSSPSKLSRYVMVAGSPVYKF